MNLFGRALGFMVTLIALMMASCTWAAEPGLVAHYTFDEGAGTIAHDASGNGNHGMIHGARYVKRGQKYCLEFNGIDNFVDCGDKPSLDIRNAITLEAWVMPESRVHGEPGILGKHFESYLLSYYSDGQCWWYISGGANNAKSLLSAGSWHHVVGTFDGRTLRLYIDGKLASSTPSRFDKIKPGKKFYIGCVVGDPSATDPAYTRTAYFPGLIDEVRIYNRAITAREVQTHLQLGLKQLTLTAAFRPVMPVLSIRQRGILLRVGKNGQVQIDTGQSRYVVESLFSYPGTEIGWNALAANIAGCEPSWSPHVAKLAPNTVVIAAEGKWYRLNRTIRVESGRIRFEDRLTHRTGEPVGLIVQNNITAPRPFRDAQATSGAENPTIFMVGEKDCLGVLAEDNLSRVRFDPSLGLNTNQGRFRVADFALDRKSVTLRWSLFLLAKSARYFDFLDQVRREWNTNFTILGPFSFFDLSSPLLDDPPALKAYLTRKRLKIAALMPWLDYDPGSFDRVWSREEYKERMQKAIRALKAADPNILCIGCIETDWVTIYPEKIAGGEKLPVAGMDAGAPKRLNAEQTRILEAAHLPWMDSAKRDEQGNLILELYRRGGKPQTALAVYPAVGNSQYAFLLNQVRFLLDEVGMDGFYIDEFSQAWQGGIPSYQGWDGISAHVDRRTGQIRRKYVDCSLAGIQARVNLVRYALDRGKVVVANTYASSMNEQALPVQRFSETQAAFDPFAAKDGEKPPRVPVLYRGALATPIGLGIVGHPDRQDTARRVMKAIITYLRHGMLYYHYAIEDIPETGPGSGEYGPINHMFPITPITLNEGWIEGKERTITCVSGMYTWRHRNKPTIHLFDLNGREKPHNARLTRFNEGWKVQVKLRDWAEIAVMGP
jgi:hypothetical protein